MSAGGDRDNETSSVRSAVEGTFELRSAQPAKEVDDDAPFSIFIYRGFERGAHDEIGIDLGAELAHTESSNDGVTTGFVSQRATLELFGWRLEQFLGYQSPTSFADAFWRSSRGLATIGGEGTVPPMWAFGHPRKFLFWAFKMRVAYSELLQTRAGSISTAEFDLDVDLDWFGMKMKHVDLGFFRTRFREYGVPLQRRGNVTRGVSVIAFDLEFANLALHLGDVTFSAAAGIGSRSPLSAFVTTNTEDGVSSVSTGPAHTVPILWFEALGKPNWLAKSTISLGAGAFSRISPDGLAADTGSRLSAKAAADLSDRVSAELSIDIASLRRALVANDPPPDLAPEGSKLLLARASGSVGFEVTDNLRLVSSAYAEKTDREDPRRHRSTPDAATWGYGIELAATYLFARD